MSAYIIVSVVGGILFGVLDALINANQSDMAGVEAQRRT